ncbi:MAG: hypothetical protein RIS35_281 [Pseudomonadota bacterium]
MMVGVLIGLLVIVAAMGTFVFTRQSGKTSGDALRLHQEAQRVFRVLQVHLAQAGSFTLVDVEDPAAGLAVSAQGGVPLGVAWAVSGRDGGSAGTDVLTVSHSSQIPASASGGDARAVSNCLDGVVGNPAAGALVVTTVRLVGDRVVCDANLDSEAGTPTEQTIARGAEDLQFRYGVRDHANGAVAYWPASSLSSASAVVPSWAQVQSLEVCLQLRGQRFDHPRLGSVIGCRGQTVPADGRLRRVFRQVIALRNHLEFVQP